LKAEDLESRVKGRIMLHLKKAPLVEKSPDHLDDPPPHDKRLAVIGVHDEIEIPLSIPAKN
jgi:hypothetical protein